VHWLGQPERCRGSGGVDSKYTDTTASAPNTDNTNAAHTDADAAHTDADAAHTDADAAHTDADAAYTDADAAYTDADAAYTDADAAHTDANAGAHGGYSHHRACGIRIS
jgi:hypothetical protein